MNSNQVITNQGPGFPLDIATHRTESAIKRKLIACLAIATIALSTSVNAAFHDFAGQGDAFENGYFEFNTDTNDDSIYNSGGSNYIGPVQPAISISASNGGSTQYAAYFDGSWTKNYQGELRDASLGVCQSGDGTACAGNTDDNHMEAVPVPAAFWMFGSALIGFVGFSRRTTL